MLPTMQSCQTVARFAASHNVDLPAAMARPLAVYDAVQAARSRPATAAVTLEKLMCGDAEPTPAVLDALLDTAALAHARAQIARDVSEDAERFAVQSFRAAFARAAGDELYAALRPAFDDAAADLAAGMALVSPGMTAAQAIEAGPETVAAWSSATSVVGRLNGFAVLANSVLREFGLVGDSVQFDHFHSRLVAQFIDAAAPPDLTGAAVAWTRGGTQPGEWRFGSWQSLVVGSGHGLRLNSPSESDAICRAHAERLAGRDEDEYNQTHGELTADVGAR